MFKGFSNLSDAERGKQFGAHQLEVMLLSQLQDLTLDEAIDAWYKAQGRKFEMMQRFAQIRPASSIPEQIEGNHGK